MPAAAHAYFSLSLKQAGHWTFVHAGKSKDLRTPCCRKTTHAAGESRVAAVGEFRLPPALT
jgi:hypothetical protein